jgi:enoyl-CoA hydratase
MIVGLESWRIGLVNRVVAADRLIPESEQLLRTILDNGPLAVRACLELVDAGLQMSVDDALGLEATWFGLLSATADMREGTRAFLEKRNAGLTGSWACNFTPDPAIFPWFRCGPSGGAYSPFWRAAASASG